MIRKWPFTFKDWKVLHKLIIPLYLMAFAGGLFIAISYYSVYSEITKQTFPAERNIARLSRTSSDLLSEYREYINHPSNSTLEEIADHWDEFNEAENELITLFGTNIVDIVYSAPELKELGDKLVTDRRLLLEKIDAMDFHEKEVADVVQKAASVVWSELEEDPADIEYAYENTYSEMTALISYGTLLNRYLGQIRRLLLVAEEQIGSDLRQIMITRQQLDASLLKFNKTAKDHAEEAGFIEPLQRATKNLYMESEVVLRLHNQFSENMEALENLENKLQKQLQTLQNVALAQTQSVFQRGIAWMTVVLVVFLLGMFSLVWYIAEHLRKRMDIIALASHEFGKGNLNARASLGGRDELSELASQFNSTADSVEQLNSELESRARELAYHATHDTLTNLTNRREFERRLKQVIRFSISNKTESVLSYMDLDQFKIVNDTCGHTAGDELLRQVADLLQEQLRSNDLLARLGGDEFGILMDHCSFEDGVKISSRLREVIENYHFLWDDKNFNVTASIGIIPINEFSGDVVEVLKTADSACYEAKDAGRNQIHVWHEDDEKIARRQGEMEWVSQINNALSDDLFQLYIQPIVPIGSKQQKKVRFEVLLRMQNHIPGRDLTLPGAFLPAAERYNLSTKIDYWVVQRVFEWLADHPEELSKTESCSINLSGLSLNDNDFLDFIVSSMEAMKIPPEIICFEVTETAAISNLVHAKRFIERLKKLGCYFSLDDFGSGLSSFAYLKTLPVDYLKIDGTFVKNAAHDKTDLAMVKNINEIGMVLQKETVAEYVEDQNTLAMMQDVGISYAQGFAIAVPEPIEDASGTPHSIWSTAGEKKLH